MLNEDIKLRPGSARKARALLRRRLADLGVDGDHILSVELVVAELVATALEQEGSAERASGRLSLELFPLLTSVRLRCPPGSVCAYVATSWVAWRRLGV